MNSEHVEVLERLRGVLEHGKMGDKCLIAPDLVPAAIAALSAPQPPAEAQPVAWKHPDALPSVESGQYGWFWVAVRRARNGRIYSFPATYLNQFQLSDERGGHVEGSGNRYHHGPIDEEEGTFPATGWHDVRDHSEYDEMFSPLLVQEGDELVAWCAVPDYGDSQPPSAPVGVDELAKSWEKAALVDVLTEGQRAVLRNCTRALRALAQQPAAADEVRIPRALAGRVMTALGKFISDESWSMVDTETANDFGAVLAAQQRGES